MEDDLGEPSKRKYKRPRNGFLSASERRSSTWFMVNNQLKVYGFNLYLSPGCLTAISRDTTCRSYARALAVSTFKNSMQQEKKVTWEEHQEDNFRICRWSLRLWSVPGGLQSSLENFQVGKLRINRSFVKDDLGEVTIKTHKDPEAKIQDEATINFETKEIRAHVKSQAQHQDDAGMRLDIPNHLQKDFHVLMKMLYVLKSNVGRWARRSQKMTIELLFAACTLQDQRLYFGKVTHAGTTMIIPWSWLRNGSFSTTALKF